MIYCDLTLNGAVVWSGRACLNGVSLRSQRYQPPLNGQLMFLDTQGASDPTWDGLGTRYQLLWLPDSTDLGASVPLQALPSQQLDVTLGVLTYTISVYENSPS